MAKKVWTPAARRAFAEKMRKARAAKGIGRKRRANPESKADGAGYIGERVEIPVHYDAWMRGAKYGIVTAFRHGKAGQSDYLLVKMDHPGIKKRLKLWRMDWPYANFLGRERLENPGRAAVHTKKFDRTVRKVKRSLKRRGAKGNAYAIAESTLGKKRSILKRHRRGNPSQHFVIGVRKPSGPFFYVPKDHRNVLVKDYARAHRFPSLRSAQAVGQHVARLTPRGYQVGVYRA